MQNLRLPVKLGPAARHCQTTGSASRRLLNSTAQLPKPFEGWHARKGSPVGTAGCPCHRSQFPALLPFSFPHPSAKKAQGGAKTKSRSLEADVQSRLCLYWRAHGQAASPPAPLTHTPRRKRALLRPHVESLLALSSDSRSIFRALLLCT